MDNMDKMETTAEEVAEWLARETGHPEATDEADEGEAEQEAGPRKYGLPQDNHEKLRRFFDGLHIEKAMTEKRQAEPLAMMDEAESMNEALKKAAPQEGY